MSENEKKKITFYSHSDCKPCEDIKRLVKNGEVDAGDAEELEIVDIDTDEGFERFEKEVLAKLPEDGEAALPSAYLDGIPCEIKLLDGDKFVIFECPSKKLPEEITEAPA